MKTGKLAGIIFILLMLALVLLTGCESKSGQIVANNPLEKIVILDRTLVGYSDNDPIYRYKVKRIDKGVVDFVELDYPFDTNDTIMYRFWNK